MVDISHTFHDSPRATSCAMSLASSLATTLFHLTRGSRLRQLLNYPSEPVSVLDPCAGIGAAIRQLTDDANTNRYAVELDAERARLAEESGIETIHANIIDVHAKVESFLCCISILPTIRRSVPSTTSEWSCCFCGVPFAGW